MNDLTVSFNYNRQDVMNFVFDTLSFEKIRCTLILIFNLTCLVIGIIFLIKKIWLLGILFVLVSLFVLPLILYLTYLAMAQSISEISSVVCTLKDNGINFITSLGDSTFEYKELFDVKITQELILVYLDDKKAIAIPKRAFKTRETATEFCAKLMERFSDAVVQKIKR